MGGEIVKFMCGNSQNMYKLQDQFTNGTFIFTVDTERFYIKMNDKIVAITPSKEELEYRAKVTPLLCPCCSAPLKVNGVSSMVKCDHCDTVSDIDSIYFRYLNEKMVLEGNKDKE